MAPLFRRKEPWVPPTPAVPFELQSVPNRGEAPVIGGSLGMILMPAASGVGAVVLAVTSQGRPLMAVMAAVVLVASIAVGLVMVIGTRTGERRRTRRVRERYLDHVEQVRRQARAAAVEQHFQSARLHPDPLSAAAARSSPLNGNLRAGQFTVRIGVGTVALQRPVRVIDAHGDPLMEPDPVCASAAAELVAHYTVLARQPITVDLSPGHTVLVSGPGDRAGAAARAMLSQLVGRHPPDDLSIVICSPELDAWDWAKWLPHTASHANRDGPLPVRLITRRLDRCAALVCAESEHNAVTTAARRRMVVILDGLDDHDPGARDKVHPTGAAFAATARAAGAVVIELANRGHSLVTAHHRVTLGFRRDSAVPPLPTDVITRCSGGDCGDEIACVVDELTIADARLMARSLAGARVDSVTRGGRRTMSDQENAVQDRAVPNPATGDVATLNIAEAWGRRPARDDLCAPIGTSADGTLVTLDVKEAAHGGSGPHGLVVGATGSGKSELLRTLLTALAIGHPPENLAFLLADFKGGATFAPLAGLPHVAGVVTNLDADAALIDRFRDALGGEVLARQELFAAAGVSSLQDYAAVAGDQTELRPLPRLLVVVDEFSEMLLARPDLTELFATIGRLGRSIGVFLLLATQRLDTGRLRGLESHLSYRICLRTFSESESREAIGGAEAFRLPMEPGWAYLVTGGRPPRLFRAATVSRPHRAAAEVPPPTASPVVLPFCADNDLAARISELSRSDRLGQAPGHDRPVEAGEGPRSSSVLDAAVRRIQEVAADLPSGRPVRPIWLPPLPARLFLGSVLEAATSRTTESSDEAGIKVPIGLIDRPERQRQEVLVWDTAQGNGNLLIVGAGRAGKSTALGALLLSAALRLAPVDLTVLCVDLDAGFTSNLQQLPHVAAVASRSDPELVRRIFTHVLTRITHAGAQPAAPRMLLLIDDWTGVLQTDPALEDQLEKILTRGPGAGVHVALTAVSPLQVRARLLAGLSSRIELRLADPFDSVIDRRLAATIGADRPGRALVAGRHFAQIALPVLTTSDDAEEATGPARNGGRCGRGPAPLARAERRPDHHIAPARHPGRDHRVPRSVPRRDRPRAGRRRPPAGPARPARRGPAPGDLRGRPIREDDSTAHGAVPGRADEQCGGSHARQDAPGRHRLPAEPGTAHRRTGHANRR